MANKATQVQQCSKPLFFNPLHVAISLVTYADKHHRLLIFYEGDNKV